MVLKVLFLLSCIELARIFIFQGKKHAFDGKILWSQNQMFYVTKRIFCIHQADEYNTARVAQAYMCRSQY